VNQQLLNFIKVLIDKDRVSVIELINVEFKKLSNEHKNTAEAIAVTAIPLTPDKMEALKEKLSKMTGKNIEITNVIDEEVIGGILVKIGNEEIDGTVKGRLGKLKEELHQIIA
jgi:F-type H+-transporting ATPase subunit delta